MSIDSWTYKVDTPFAAVWMDLEIIILIKTNIILYHLYVESKKMIPMNLIDKTEIGS